MQSLVSEETENLLTHIALSKDGVFRTLQGEGPNIGRPTTFIRLGGCNLACSWCDTSYTWDWTARNGVHYTPQEEVYHLSIKDLATEVLEVGADSLTITGGEPLLQHKALAVFFKYLKSVRLPQRNGYYPSVHFETNGTIWPGWSDSALRWNPAYQFYFSYVVSPKLQNSHNTDASHSLEVLSKFVVVTDSVFKFVCETPNDLLEVDTLLTSLDGIGAHVDPSRVWIMPQGVEPGVLMERARQLAPGVIQRNWNLTPRLHIALWGNERGR